MSAFGLQNYLCRLFASQIHIPQGRDLLSASGLRNFVCCVDEKSASEGLVAVNAAKVVSKEEGKTI